MSSDPMHQAELTTLHERLLTAALHLVEALDDAIADAPLSQRASALGLVIDRLLKLDQWLQAAAADPAADKVIRFEYTDADGSVHHTPHWARGDSAHKSAVPRGGLWPPFREDGGGEADSE